MRLRLIGHDYKYAVEQIMLTLFPGELPVYDGGDGRLSACVRLSSGPVFTTASTVIHEDGVRRRASARVRTDALTGARERDRKLQAIIKRSFYKAAAAGGRGSAWGALTGIRPAKTAESMLKRGLSERAAASALTSGFYVSPERAALCAETARRSLDAAASLGERDAALYIGIPFCPTRCAYCSFVSNSVEKSAGLIEPFLDALKSEIAAAADIAGKLGLRLRSVYVGGGTPTTLTASALDSLLGSLRGSFDMSLLREYTVEAGRPDTITREKLRVMRARGVTRVSVNPQSMSDSVLETIGRRHTADDVAAAVADVRNEGFESLNMDVIAGLPSDTPAGFAGTLERVLAMRPENITVHTLSLKKGSRITLEGGAGIPDGAAVSRMLGGASERLRGAGYAPYYLYRQKYTSGGFENVGWSRPGYESAYNVYMMEELCTVLACGGGGVTKLVDPASGRIERIFNPKYPREYIERIGGIIEKKSRIYDFYSGK
ncbi:MAG: coproporphyrinogen dehydrogenase HemZ [Oscillospiraceae bacterium]|jgi:oxygen-independent coproporphyrinogen-3 oxidase|nr:coproporphyrinogen dehydrogenase HemZ [Oscillospiraceae bacterium]